MDRFRLVEPFPLFFLFVSPITSRASAPRPVGLKGGGLSFSRAIFPTIATGELPSLGPARPMPRAKKRSIVQAQTFSYC